MEVLVATMIFVSIMVIATGVIGQASSYSGKIKKLRETSAEARRLSDMITRDIREANAPVVLDSEFFRDNGDPSDLCIELVDEGNTVTFKSGLAILSWRRAVDGYTKYSEAQSQCIDEAYRVPDGLFYGNGHGLYDARMLVVGLKNKTRVYATAQDTNANPRVHRVYMKEFTQGKLSVTDINSVVESANLISNPNYGAIVGFGGYAPPSSTDGAGKPLPRDIKQQPVIRFLVTVQSKDYIHNDIVSPKVHKGEQAVIRSMATSRNYDI
jgi:hypothetical protein